jgi:hypothetical protein
MNQNPISPTSEASPLDDGTAIRLKLAQVSEIDSHNAT